MLKNIVTTTGKRVYKRLPKSVQDKALKLASPHIYKLHTKGIVADSQMVESVKKNPRPVSIVIPSYNDYPLLKACIESIYETCENFLYEIIVVDDFCQEENRKLLKTLESDTVRLILKNEREGFAKAVNRGMSEAKYDILLLNSDIVAQPGWLEALQYSAYEIDEKIGLVSPKLVYPDGRIQYGGTYYARVLAPQWFGHLYVGRAATTPSANVPFYNRSISGACVYITQKAFKELQYLDDTYWLGFEDVDYGLEAWKKGIRCYYQPAAMLVHYESASRGYSQGKKELASMRYFWSKWANLFMKRTMALDNAKSVDYILSEASQPLWRTYVDQQATTLRSRGYAVDIHTVKLDERNEKLISILSKKQSLKICCDWGAQTTTWLSGLDNGKAVYLLSGIESIDYGENPEQQAKIIAQYRPEFDYITPNRWTTDQLRAETAWEAASRVVPAIKPQAAATKRTNMVAVVDASKEQKNMLNRLFAQHNFEGNYLETKAIDEKQLANLTEQAPTAVIVLSEQPNSLLSLSLMSTGGAYIGVVNDKTRYEVLDGYNALLVAPGDIEAVGKALNDILTDESVRTSLSTNGYDSAKRYYELNQHQIFNTLENIAQTAV